MRPLVIVHISDLHIRNGQTPELSADMEHLLVSVPRHNPDLILVTGDIVESPWIEDLRKGAHFLETLREQANIAESRLLVIPGNHDYKVKGFIGGRLVDSLTGAASASNFLQVFPNSDCPFITCLAEEDMPPVSIFGFDSNGTKVKLSLATGKVESNQIAEFQRRMQDHPQRKAIASSYKIALLHHHCMPIADSETGRITDRDAFLVMDNAGTFMNEMCSQGVDLILHGHKHYFGTSCVKLRVGRKNEHTIAVVGAGSACKEGVDEFSYNVITLYPDGRVALHRWFRKTGSFTGEEGGPIFLRDYKAVRERRFAAASPRIQSTTRSRSLVIDRKGSGHLHDEYRDLRLASEDSGGEAIRSLPFPLSSGAGMIQTPQFKSCTPGMADPKFVSETSGLPGNSMGGRVEFDRSFSASSPISFDVELQVRNGFYLDAGLRQAATKDKSDVEFVSVGPMGKCAVLNLMVRFPDEEPATGFDFRPVSVFIQVEDEKENRVISEEEYCRPFLHYSALLKTASLTLTLPQPGYKYKLSWRLPSGNSTKGALLHPLVEGQASRIVDCFLRKKLLPGADLSALLGASFMKLKAEILEAMKDDRPSHDLSLYLMVYDEVTGRIKCVASTLPEEHWLWRWDVKMGHGVVGQAYLSDEAIFCFPRLPNDPATGFYVRPDLMDPGEEDPSVIVSVPLRYPVGASTKQGRIVGVLNVSSWSSDTSLLKLFGNKALQGEFEALIQSRYLREVLCSLGLSPAE